MVLPARRWYLGGLALALIAPLALVVPWAGALLLVADLLWLTAWGVDAFRVGGPGSATLAVTREAPPA